MQPGIMTKMKVMAVSSLAGVLALTSFGMAAADSQPEGSQAKQGVFGSVTAKNETSLSVKTKQGETLQLTVTGDTRFRTSGKSEVGLGDIPVGSRVAVLAQGSPDQMTALKVMAVPGEPQGEHRVLTVVDVSGKTVTAEDAQGNKVVVELDHEIGENVKGMLITFIGEKSEKSNRFKANAEVKIEQVVKRLETQAKKLDKEAKGEANAEVRAKKERESADLKARLNANMERQLDLFAEIIARAPEQAKSALEQARSKVKQGFENALEALGNSKAQAEARLKLRNVHGTVSSINSQTNEITITSPREASITLKVTADTQIRIGEEAGTLASIAAGDQVKARFNEETLAATEIRVQTEVEVEGTIESVDSAAGKLVVALADETKVTLTVAAETEIEVNGKKATIADLKPKQMVEVEYDARTMTALEIEAETKAEVEGTIKAVDAAAGTVTILAEDGSEVTIKVIDSTRVKIKGLLMGILGLSAGMEVEAEYDLTTGEATELKAKDEKEAPRKDREKDKDDDDDADDADDDDDDKGKTNTEAEINATVKSVDATGQKLVIELRDGSAKELGLTGETMIRIRGQVSPATDLKSGMKAEIRYDVNTGAALRINATEKGNEQAPRPTQTPTPTPPVSIDAAALYAANCAVCHGINRQGGAGGPALTQASMAGKPSSRISNAIANGREDMPRYSNRLSSAQIKSLVQYLQNTP